MNDRSLRIWVGALLLALALPAVAQTINLATNVRGNLSVNNLNGGLGATSGAVWTGAGAWMPPSSLGYVVGPASATSGDVVLFDGITGKLVKDAGALSYGSLAAIGANTILGNNTAGSATPVAIPIGGCSSASSALIWTTSTGFGCNTSIIAATVTTNANLTGPVTSSGNATTITSTIAAGGPVGSATVAPIITYNAAGQLTAVSIATIAPTIGSVTGLGTGVATALGVNVGTAGAPIVNGGALGTPSGGTVTNLTGTAAINITGTVSGNTITTGTGTLTIVTGGQVLCYKSGTWTPGFSGYTIVGGSSGSTATYVRIGKKVEVGIDLIAGTSSISTAGSSWVTGAPYTITRPSALVGAANTGTGVSFGSGYANSGNGIFTPSWGATASVQINAVYETDDACS